MMRMSSLHRNDGSNNNNDMNSVGDAAPPLALPEDMEWQSMPCMKVARAGCASVTIGNTIYVVGGFSGSLSSSCHAVEALTLDASSLSENHHHHQHQHHQGRRRYNSHNNERREWKVETFMRHRRNRCAAAPLGRNKVVVVGGYKSSAEVYDTSTKSWSELPKMKCKRHGCAAATLGEKVYVFGGCSAFADPISAVSAEVYDAETKTWTAIAPIPTPRSLCAATPIDDRTILVMGGKNKWNGPALNVVEAYDTFTNTWSILPPMTTPRAGLASAAVQGDGGEAILVVVGGNDSTSSHAEIYMESRRTWTALPATMQACLREDCTVAVLGNHVLAIGGKGTGGEALRTAEVLSLEALVQTSCANGSVTLPTLPPPPSAPSLPETNMDDHDVENRMQHAQALEQYADQVEHAMIKVARCKTALLTDLRRNRDETVIPLQNKIEQLQQTVRRLQESIRRTNLECRESVEAVEDEVGPWMADADERAREARDVAAQFRYDAAIGEDDPSNECLVSTLRNKAPRACHYVNNNSNDTHHKQSNHCHPSSTLVQEEQRQDSTDDTTDTKTTHSPNDPSLHIPNELLCKINGELMQDPVLAMDGHTYERSIIRMWFSQFPPHRNPRSPVTNDLLPSRHLVTNYSIRKMCREFVEERTTAVVVAAAEEEAVATTTVATAGAGCQEEDGSGGGGVKDGKEEVERVGMMPPSSSSSVPMTA